MPVRFLRGLLAAATIVTVSAGPAAADYLYRYPVKGAAPVTTSAPVPTCTAAKQILTYTGASQAVVVPTGCTVADVKLWGAGGGAGNNTGWGAITAGGAGGFAGGRLAVTPGESLAVIVGQGGWTAGGPAGPSYGGGGQVFTSGGGVGGGRSAIRRGSAELITAGGGGGGSNSTNYEGSTGGAGGGLSGGSPSGACGQSGGGASQAAGGCAGAYNGATAGSQFQGGGGGSTGHGTSGGGGGWFGGGGSNIGAGGGGSSHCDAAVQACALTAGSGTTPGNAGDADRGTGGDSAGHGRVVIVWSAGT